MAIKEKHLDHIQAVITRHNSNSFMIKGWTITICTAIFALAGTWKEPILAIISIVPIIVFWLLDTFYLANERCFVSLYSAAIDDYKIKVKNKQLLKEHQVITKLSDGKSEIDPEREIEIKSSEYSMDFTPFQAIERNNMKDAFWSISIRWFYIMLMIFSIALFTGLLFLNKPTTNEPIKVSTSFEADSLVLKTETPQIIVNNIVLNDSIIKTDTLKTKR
jgi:hypothetical protein